MSEINYPDSCEGCPNNPDSYEDLSHKVSPEFLKGIKHYFGKSFEVALETDTPSISPEMDKLVDEFLGDFKLEFNEKYIDEMGGNDET